jgi:signal transduction histidine kinase
MTCVNPKRLYWLRSVRARVAMLAVFVITLVALCGLAFFLVIVNTESAVTSETQHHLATVADTLARDYINHAEFQQQKHESPPLQNPMLPGSDNVLSVMTGVVLRSETGSEGGFYSTASNGLLGYAFPTHEGPGIKRDIPPVERPMIEDVARRAASTGQAVSYIYQGDRDVVLFEAAPITVEGNSTGSAWVMKRIPKLRSQANLGISLGVAGFVTLSLLCVLVAFFLARDLRNDVSQIEARLHALDQDLSAPPDSFHGLAELKRIHQRINELGDSLRQKIQQERDLRDELQQKERLAALGQVAAGVAHEVRNPLATIRLRTQMNQRASGDPTIQRNSEIALEEIERLNAIAEQLLYFARPLKLNTESVELADLLRDCIAAKSAVSSVRVEFTPPEREIPVRADRHKLRQVFDNVLSNAIEAVEGSGVVQVRASVSGDLAQAQFQDSGKGIPEEIKDKVFNPFFTTKSIGTGLGLSIAYEIVHAQGGTINLANAAEGGAIVTVQLPMETQAQKARNEEALREIAL